MNDFDLLRPAARQRTSNGRRRPARLSDSLIENSTSSVEYERLTRDHVGRGHVRLPGLWVAALDEAENARTGVVKVPAVVGYGHNAGCVP